MEDESSRAMWSGLENLVAITGGQTRKLWATITVWILTAATGTAQLLHPILLDQFRRNPEALAAGQWWRMVTPMFFQDRHLTGTVFNLVILAVIGAHA